MKTKILSFGAGVNSTAILCLYVQGDLKIDHVVFADTKGEMPETYDFIKKWIRPLCKKLELPFSVVSKGSLYDHFFGYNCIPFRMFRSCTDKFKIRPIHKFIKDLYGEETSYILGIDYGETHRADRFKGAYEFPLISKKINREKCKTIIENFGFPIPVKSGCYFCPFTKKAGWLSLLKNHRDLFLKAEELEKNSRKYPKYTLTHRPLEQIRLAVDNQKSLCEWVEPQGEGCIFCHS